jgi:hypothetical protein
MKLSEDHLMKESSGASVPEASLRRLPPYHYYLVGPQAQGFTGIPCSAIGRDLRNVPVQVLKDLQFTGIIGKPKVGYCVAELLVAIESLLGWNSANEAFLVGTGNLGTAILGHERFSRFGPQVVAAFDNDPRKVGECRPWQAGFVVRVPDSAGWANERPPGNYCHAAGSGAGNRRGDGEGRDPGHLEFCSGEAEPA